VGTKGIEMDILKLSADWAKSEVFSSKIVWLFSLIELSAALGFWYFGRTPMAKSFIWPLFIAGLLIALVGAGLFFANNPRIDRFQQEYRLDPNAFVQSEIQRTEKSKGELALVFRIVPAVIMLAAAVILLVSDGAWRAIAITVIINAAFLMIVDSNTEARNNIYHYQLSLWDI
jgi:ABC-2 type transport system permease protein